MIVKAQKLRTFLNRCDLTQREFAEKLGVDISEVDKMLNGEAVGYDTARRFVYCLKADCAHRLIDWDKLGVKNPLAKDHENICDDVAAQEDEE